MMNKNIENYKKALNELKANDELKEKTLNNVLKICEDKDANPKDKSTIQNDNNLYKNSQKRTITKLRVATYSLCTVLASAVIVLSTVLYNDNLYKDFTLNLASVGDSLTSKVEEKDMLPTVGTLENLNKILSGMSVESVTNDALSTVNKDMTEMARSDSFMDYSETNIQVEGVDEADIVKTDGNYIYYIANRKVYIVNTKNPQDIKIESVLEYEENFIPKELYINDNKLVVILNKSEMNNYYSEYVMIDVAYYDGETVAITYDMRSRENILEKRRVEVDGRYISSRMINDEVYLITNEHIHKIDENYTLPQYKDTMKDDEKHDVSLEKMLYVPETKNKDYLIIVGFSLNNNNEANVKTILGTGDDIYCTENNLYVTCVEYDEPVEVQNGLMKYSLVNTKYYTKIYKFKLQDTNIISTATGKVAGRTLNQFSMGEYNKNLSIVTTENYWDGSSNSEVKNTLYILNENLEQIGILENIAEDENLYAVRFMGDKGYIVTFEQVDPLFVIDISNPTAPKILGELKVPGYSSYLHPYGENYLIGIGQDTEIEQTKYGTRTVIKGVKVSLFDVSDYENPREVHSLVINDKSNTNASYDHKAVLFSKEKNLLAFPLSSWIDKELKQEYVVLSIDLENGISIKNTINHGYTDTGYGKYMVNIDRGVYIDDNLFTLSNKKIVVSSGEEEFSLNIN